MPPPRVAGNNPAPPQTAPKAKAKRVKVRATRLGYYDYARRREGDVFIADEADLKNSSWMERVPATTPESISTAQDSITRQHDELLATRAGSGGEEL